MITSSKCRPRNSAGRFRVTIYATRSGQGAFATEPFELYAHDFSEFHDVELGEDGRFGFKNLHLYWSDPRRHAFLINCRRKLAGFVLVKQGSEITEDDCVWDMAEFFVLRRYRRDGVGTEAARQIWDRYPGCWEVRVMEANKAAQAFWARAIKSLLNQAISPVRVQIADRVWVVFALDSAQGR